MTTRTWTVEDVRALGVTTDVPTAGSVLGLGSTQSREMARRGEFPCRVLSLGRLRRVIVADLLTLLGLDTEAS